MARYRRVFLPGGYFFFTIVTYDRHSFLVDPYARQSLKDAIQKVRSKWPFDIIATVLLPNHIHSIWKMPENDSNYTLRWSLIKRYFKLPPEYQEPERSLARIKRRERAIWQRRFWEHTIRDEEDLYNHVHYIHYNPVKHGYVRCPHEWPYSSFHRWVKQGIIEPNWGCQCKENWDIPDFLKGDNPTVGE